MDLPRGVIKVEVGLRAVSETRVRSAVERAERSGGVGKGKFTTCKKDAKHVKRWSLNGPVTCLKCFLLIVLITCACFCEVEGACDKRRSKAWRSRC